MQWKTIGIFLLGACVLSGCNGRQIDSTHAIKSTAVTSSDITQKPIALKNAVLPIPKTLRPIQGTLEYTSYIGTPGHPTINGGIINSTSSMPVNHDAPVVNPVPSKISTAPASLAKTAPINTAKNTPNDNNPSKNNFTDNTPRRFNDNWATSQKVKALLLDAAKQGKLGYVLNKTNQMGLPASVAVVPMVESNYQTKAISPKGAAGAWQLMPTTAKTYGINNQERFAFRASTKTALKFLTNLHQQFGNWTLAFAAYNAGSNRVIEALQKNPNATSINALDLPEETKLYVTHIMDINKTLKLMAVKYDLNIQNNYHNNANQNSKEA